MQESSIDGPLKRFQHLGESELSILTFIVKNGIYIVEDRRNADKAGRRKSLFPFRRKESTYPPVDKKPTAMDVRKLMAPSRRDVSIQYVMYLHGLTKYLLF